MARRSNLKDFLAAPKPEPTKPDGSLDLARITREAAALGPGLFGFILWLDAKLVERGFHAMSPLWKVSIGDFLASEKRFGVWRVGRGGGKSCVLVRIAVAAVLFTERHVPPGQRWIWPFISVTSEDAQRRIQEIAAILAVIGVVPTKQARAPHPIIELEDARGNAMAFIALASNIRGVSGPSTGGGTIDEEAKLLDKAIHANPATEILASLAQTFRGREAIFGIRCSSAYGKEGSHYEAIEEGDTPTTFVARLGAFADEAKRGCLEVAAWEEEHGNAASARRVREYAETITPASANIPTWVANPTIDPVASRIDAGATPASGLDGLSPASYWLRENASVPMAGGGGALSEGILGLAERNAELVAGKVGLQRFPGLPASDPRSLDYRGPWGIGGGGSVL